LGQSLLVLQLLVLLLKEIVGLGGLGELRVHEFVLASEGLNVFAELLHLGRLDLHDLLLVIELVSEVLVLLPEQLDFILSFEESPLEIIFLAGNDRHLVLHVAEVKDLLLQFLLGAYELLRLLVELRLHLVKVSVEAGDALFQIEYFLVLGHQVSLVILDIVLQDGFIVDFLLFVLGSGLKSLDQLFLTLVQVLDK